jgi:hypothetical protein
VIQTIQQRGQALSGRIFLGGSLGGFEAIGRLQLITALREGLNPWSKVVDIGCGCLRGGYWFIHFLNPDSYCGIEPDSDMLREGVQHILEPSLVEEKRPRFDNNAAFDTSVFGKKFDFFVARSVWTHASKPQIQVMLDAFRRDAAQNGVFLTSYLRARPFFAQDYRGERWIGRSHESSDPGLVRHSFKWIAQQCAERKLEVRELREDVENGQIWLRITR